MKKGAPKKAVAEYNEMRKRYLDQIKSLKTEDEMLSFFISERETFSFPLDEETENCNG